MTRLTSEKYGIGIFWREDKLNLPNNFYSALGQLKYPERRLYNDYTLKKRYQETIDTEVKAGYVGKIKQDELIETRAKLQWYLPNHPVTNPHKPQKNQKIMQCNCKVLGCSPQRQFCI